MDNDVLRSQYERLRYPADLDTMIEAHKLITDAAFAIIHAQKGKSLTSVDEDASLLFQMTVLKNISLLKLSESLQYTNDIDGVSMNGTFDPFSMANIIRAQYEAFCNFNNIYIISKTEEEKIFKYNLWVISGFNYRQRFEATMPETIQKKEIEREEIETYLSKIKDSTFYKDLTEEAQKIFSKQIKSKEWKFIIDGSKIKLLSWHDLFRNSGVGDILEGLYTDLSLKTHPSNVSVFQFSDIYKSGYHVEATRMALYLSQVFTAFLIREYCVYFEDSKNVFDNLPEIHQLLINAHNFFFRGPEYTVNDFGNNADEDDHTT